MSPCTTAYGRYWSTEIVLNNIVILFNNVKMQEHATHYSARVYKNKLSYTTPFLCLIKLANNPFGYLLSCQRNARIYRFFIID